jgi:AraC-like DNA-binding protein
MTKIIKLDALPFFELRYITEVLSCEKRHEHDEYTLVAIKEGCLYIDVNNKRHELIPNTLGLVNPFEVHSSALSNMSSKGCYVVYLDFVWCKNLRKELFESHVIDESVLPNLLEEHNVYETFIQLCNDVMNEKISCLEKEEKWTMFVSELFLKYAQQTIPKIPSKALSWAEKIKSYIHENLQEEIMLQDISHALDLSVIHILRVFKQTVGLSIHAYILNEKVHFAKGLIEKNIPICEVAQQSGFFDQSHLNREFKKVFQLTPRAYQKNIIF